MDGFLVCAQGERKGSIGTNATASAAHRVGFFFFFFFGMGELGAGKQGMDLR